MSLAVADIGLCAASYDREYPGKPVSMDLNSLAGFLVALCIVLLLVPGGVAWFAVPCNSLGAFAARSVYGRTACEPDGNARAAPWNRLIQRSFILARVAQERGIHVFFENPAHTFLFRLSFATVLGEIESYKPARILLGSFGAATLKAIGVFSRCGWLDSLPKQTPDRPLLSTGTQSENAAGKKSYTGNDLAKLSQIYPFPFGQAVAKVFRGRVARLKITRRLEVDAIVSPLRTQLSESQQLQLREAALVAPGVDLLRARWAISPLGVPLVNAVQSPTLHNVELLVAVARSIKPLGAPPWNYVCASCGEVYILRGRNWHRLQIQKEARRKKADVLYYRQGLGDDAAKIRVHLGAALLVAVPPELAETQYHVKKRPASRGYRSSTLRERPATRRN
jgi:hypothetical protein